MRPRGRAAGALRGCRSGAGSSIRGARRRRCGFRLGRGLRRLVGLQHRVQLCVRRSASSRAAVGELVERFQVRVACDGTAAVDAPAWAVRSRSGLQRRDRSGSDGPFTTCSTAPPPNTTSHDRRGHGHEPRVPAHCGRTRRRQPFEAVARASSVAPSLWRRHPSRSRSRAPEQQRPVLAPSILRSPARLAPRRPGAVHPSRRRRAGSRTRRVGSSRAGRCTPR